MGSISPEERKKHRAVKQVTSEENESYKKLWDTDHPDFVTPELQSLYNSEPEELVKINGPLAKDLGKIFLEEKKKSNFDFDNANRPKLVRNEILGYVEQHIIDEALRRGAISKKYFMGNEYWCIVAEEILVGEENGRVLSTPKKNWKVSDTYRQFMEDLKNNKIKKPEGVLL